MGISAKTWQSRIFVQSYHPFEESSPIQVSKSLFLLSSKQTAVSKDLIPKVWLFPGEWSKLCFHMFLVQTLSKLCPGFVSRCFSVQGPSESIHPAATRQFPTAALQAESFNLLLLTFFFIVQRQFFLFLTFLRQFLYLVKQFFSCKCLCQICPLCLTKHVKREL